jgi:hypothetical protein
MIHFPDHQIGVLLSQYYDGKSYSDGAAPGGHQGGINELENANAVGLNLACGGRCTCFSTDNQLIP